MRRSFLIIVLALLVPGAAVATPTGPIWISEVMHDPAGFLDFGSEWVELYNTTGSTVSLDTYELRWGYDSYNENTLSLFGYSILGGDTFVIGGPTSNANNGNPVYDLVSNIYFLGNDPFNNDAFGVALFDTSVSNTIPVATVIYGSTNTDLVDEQGNIVAPYIDSSAAGDSLEFDGVSWVYQATPNPNSLVMTPEPGTGVLFASGLAWLGWHVQRRRRRAAA